MAFQVVVTLRRAGHFEDKKLRAERNWRVQGAPYDDARGFHDLGGTASAFRRFAANV